MMAAQSRLAPCHCGSGKRYKDCHGRTQVPTQAPADFSSLMQSALAAQRAGLLTEADIAYRSALALRPEDFDALHMLGVVQLQLGKPRESVRFISRALEIEGWSQVSALHNLGLALAQSIDPKVPTVGLGSLGTAYRRHLSGIDVARGQLKTSARPLVSVIVPSFNHGAYIEAAVRSVFSQTYQNWELLVIDDGSGDDSVSRLRELLPANDERCRLIVRENRGAAATLNELLSLARGEWVQPLNSDDALAPDRLEVCVRAVAGASAKWLFGSVRCIDASGMRIDELTDTRAFSFRTVQAAVAFEETVGVSFLAHNPAISTGNLFFTADLARRLGGFRDLRYHHDWDFCLRALNEAEPLHITDALYYYRLHDRNTISEQTPLKQAEIDSVLSRFIAEALSTIHRAANPWAPAYCNWGARLATMVLVKGLGKLLPTEWLRDRVAVTLSEQPR